MNIETKYNIGEKVFIIVNDQITQVRVSQIKIHIDKKLHIGYVLRWLDEKYTEKDEHEVYRTKLEIIQ